MADVKRLQIRRDTLADWVSVNPILLEGEVGLIIENGGISSLKIGDGVSSFTQLKQLTLLEAVFGGYVSRQDLSASLRDYATIQYVDSEIGNILGGASGAYDTLKEIEDILKNDTTGLAALLEEIGTKADKSTVAAINSRVTDLEDADFVDIDSLRSTLGGYYTKEDVDALLGEAGGVDLTGYFNEIAASGTGNGIASVSKDGSKLTFNKATFLTDATVPAARTTFYGGIKIGYKDNGKNYGVLLDDSGKAYVNVPWESYDLSKFLEKDGGSVNYLQVSPANASDGETINIGVTTNEISGIHGNGVVDWKINSNGAWIGTNQLATQSWADGKFQTQITGTNKLSYSLISGTPTLAAVATSGNYNDLSNKPTIPSAVTESTVLGWGFTKNAGTITGIKMNGASKGTSGVVDLGTVLTSHQTIHSLTIKPSDEGYSLTYTPNSSSLSITLGKSWVGLGNVENKSSATIRGEITSSNVTTALGYTPYNSANFTKANIKSTLGISDWALASSKPTYTAEEVGALPSTTVIPNSTIVANWGFITEPVINDKLANYLPLSGGTITSQGADFLTINRTDGENSVINFNNNGTFLGRLGYNLNGTPIAQVNGAYQSLIHSGNISSQSVQSAYTAQNATIADKATNDSAGNKIVDTYLKKSDYNDSIEGLATESWVSQQGYAVASLMGVLNITNAAGNTATFKPYNNGPTSLTINKSFVGLSNVENTALSTWAGSDNITTLGTITIGTWNGSKITNAYLEKNTIKVAGQEIPLGGEAPAENLKGPLGITALSSTVANHGTIINDLDTRFSDYLPLSGGTITSQGADFLTINRTDGENSVINFNNNGTFLGRLGYNLNGTPIAQVNGAYQSLIHSGNYSSYALPLTGGTISGSLTFSATTGSHIIGNSNSEIIFQPSNDTSGANIPLKIAKTGSSTYTMYCDESEVYDLGTSSYKWNILYCRSASQSSDATLKNILGNVELTTSQIANAPAVNFTWKNGGTKDVGTIAQYWKNVLPEVVSGEEGSYGMNYAVLGVVSSIILARNIETHEQRIARLEKEISDLQKELNALVNNE